MNSIEYRSDKDKQLGLTGTRREENSRVNDYSGNYAASQHDYGMKTKKNVQQDMKHTMEVIRIAEATISEIERKSKNNNSNKISDSKKLGHPTIKGKEKKRMSKKTKIKLIVIGSLFVLLVIICGISFVYNDIMVCNGYKATNKLYFEMKSCNLAPYFKPSSKLLVTSILIKKNSFMRAKSFRVDGFRLLNKITIHEGSFSRVGAKFPRTNPQEVNRYFGVLNCPQLTSIYIGSYCFAEWNGEFELRNLPALEVLEFGSSSESTSYSFYHKALSMSGIHKLFQ